MGSTYDYAHEHTLLFPRGDSLLLFAAFYGAVLNFCGSLSSILDIPASLVEVKAVLYRI